MKTSSSERTVRSSRTLALALCTLANMTGCAAKTATAAPTVAPATAAVSAKASARGPSEQWCIRQVEDQDGNMVFLTMNLGYREWPGKQVLPYLVHVNVTTSEMNANGHPTDGEARVLDAVEARITTRLLEGVQGQYVGRATTRGFRELMYYVSSADAAESVMKVLAPEEQVRQWQYRISEDPDWQVVMPLLAAEPACL